MISTAGSRRAPISIGSSVSSGQQIVISPPVETPEFNVSEDDLVLMTCLIENKTHTDLTKAFSDALKIAGAVIAVIAAGEAVRSTCASSAGKATTAAFLGKDSYHWRADRHRSSGAGRGAARPLRRVGAVFARL